ncbi:MAG TPA: hypothetical protein VNT26_09515, partial [Candidatus Sulfotelmatobacter sp.]|nr:hypothetical protein [Candidatus Sulfotelmatobacter sp.]
GLLFIPGFIYCYDRIQQLSWVMSIVQVVFGLSILYWCRGSLNFRWPLMAESQLPPRRFSWLNFTGFVLGNVVVLLPVLVAYLFLCAALAVGHYSAGFLALRPGGVMVRVRDYVRDDGKTIQLVPMAHVGDPDFYHNLSQSFPSNSVILMEGVTDNRNLITNQVNYERMATSLGLAEQHKEFTPERGEWVRADVDVEQFSTNTIGFLNLAMLVHAKGVNSETVLKLMQDSPPPQIMEQIFDDIIKKRNRHLLDEIQARLPQSEHLIVPWGAAHMPGLAGEIQRSGFRLHKSRDFQVIRFGFAGPKNKSVKQVHKDARTEAEEGNQREGAPK